MFSKHLFVGNLGADPELRYTASGQAYARFSLAVNRRWTTTAGERRDETTWYRVVVWGKLAEICQQYCTKGMRVLVEGEHLKASAYLDKAGQPAASMELTARVVQFLGTPGRGEQAPASAPVVDEGDEEEMPF